MICLKIFAFAVFLGAITASEAKKRLNQPSNGGFSFNDVRYNSFAYLQNFTQAQTHDPYASFVVSKTSGPLCSGFHISVALVVTTASCVIRESPGDVFVISNSKDTNPPTYYIFHVEDIICNSNYDPKSQYYDVALLVTIPRKKELPAVLNLPEQLPKKLDPYATSYFFQWLQNDTSNTYHSMKLQVQVMSNMNACGLNSTDNAPLLCVHVKNHHFPGFTPMNTGAPLIIKCKKHLCVYGIFSDRSFHTDKGYYVYQDLTKNENLFDLYQTQEN